MLPVYKAQGFDSIMEGGATRPWLILVKVNETDVPYVVKVYTEHHLQSNYCVAKDVYCSILAREFDLPTAAPALIEFPSYFINGLKWEQRELLREKDTRIKFGSKLISGSYDYNSYLHRDRLEKYDIGSIYAFDNLILNGDRSSRKPNILLKDNDRTAYLIDHELALNNNKIIDFQNNASSYYYKTHIFHSFLKNSKKEDKEEYFHTFESYLRDLNTNILDDYYNQMINFSHHIPDEYNLIKDYLCNLKQKPGRFINLLLGQIT